MQLVFGDRLNKEETRQLAQSFYAHFIRSFKENIVMRFLSEKKIIDKVKVEGATHLSEALSHGKGVLILTGHLGNWEFAPIGGILQFKTLRGCFYFIRRTLKVKWIEKLLFSRYHKAGLKVIPAKDAVNQACDALEKNKLVVFVMDQHAQVTRAGNCRKDGVPVEFFGKKAGTYRSLAMIARYSGAKVVPAASYRRKDGEHVLAFYPEIPWQSFAKSSDAISHNTLSYNQALEQFILKHPEQWIWMHKRWKL
jgi:KDO2-lipid IV(A) lauroyltransferase